MAGRPREIRRDEIDSELQSKVLLLLSTVLLAIKSRFNKDRAGGACSVLTNYFDIGPAPLP